MDVAPSHLRRSLGPVAIGAQAVGTVGLTLTAVINIPAAAAVAGRATWIAYAIALVAIVLVSETLVLFRHHPAGAAGIAGYVEQGLGAPIGRLACWALLLGYGATLLACLAFLGFYIEALLPHLGLPVLPELSFLLGAAACWAMARRDVHVSTTTMLITETISVLIVLGLCALVLRQGGSAADLSAISPVGDSASQVRAGLMIAVLSFIGFESAANLGAEALRPERSVPQALRTAVLVAGGLFLVWAVVLTEGLSWLPAAARAGIDPISTLADQLGRPGAGIWIRIGAFLCLFGSGLGCLTALTRVTYRLAQERVLPKALQRLHPRWGTPTAALNACYGPLVLLGLAMLHHRFSASRIYDLLGGFGVLAFLLVYGLVAVAALRHPLEGVGGLRRRGIASGALLAVAAVGAGYGSSLWNGQAPLLLSFVALLGVGAALVLRRR
ncbi:APC family permease [Vulcanococcus sp.]|jgi:amino acid transporter|uniref:APC family permease n=1 Tax=Vulcanococcus sp. TaxID=2856995 RepID=UPI0037D9DB79